MLKLKSHKPSYTVSVDIFALPEDVQSAVREYSVASDNVYDYRDGDYYTVPDFSLLEQDKTPDDVVEAHLCGDLDEEDYPLADAADSFDDLDTYLQWLKALRFIAANVPPGTLETERVAIQVWH